MWSIVVCSSSVIEGFNSSPSLLPRTIHCIFSLRCCNYIPVLALGNESQQCIVIISSAEGIVTVLSKNFSQSEAQWVPSWPIRVLISSCASTCTRHLSWWRLGPIAYISLIKYRWLQNFLLLQKLIFWCFMESWNSTKHSLGKNYLYWPQGKNNWKVALILILNRGDDATDSLVSFIQSNWWFTWVQRHVRASKYIPNSQQEMMKKCETLGWADNDFSGWDQASSGSLLSQLIPLSHLTPTCSPSCRHTLPVPP